ncbi:hypothetical protein GCM10009737_11900 [Nocardioides lentus]|uniref:Transglutaminase-like domain-containing protein n=1 Tax=Nocardioides lentus TaxID=338077 RepID=A0ABP5AFX6_9ACTN
MSAGRDLRLSLTAMLTTWTAVLAWRGFTENADRFLVPLLVVGLAVAVTGTLGRLAALPSPVVVLAQLVVAGLGVLRDLTGAWVPGPATLGVARDVLVQAADSAVVYAAPVAGDVPPVEPLLLVAATACLLLVDVTACTLRRVPLAGLPLLTVYTLPVSMLGGGVAWWVFALPAAGFVSMLYQHTEAELDRWDAPSAGASGAPGGPGAADAAGFGVRTGGVRGTALGIGTAATALAVGVPLLVPTLGLAVLDGPGPGDGTDEITLDNPMADLNRDLRRPRDTPLLQVTTDDPDPSYLRISVLNRFSDNAWTSGDRDLPDSQLARGAQPEPVGVAADVPRTTEDWRIDVTDEFASTWLPAPYPAAGVRAQGAWKYDETTRDYIAAEDDLTTAGLSYETTALDLELDPERLALSDPGTTAVGAEFRDLPSDLPLEVVQLARAATSGADDDFGRAVALQQWFRRDGGFTYDLSVEPGNGSDALLAFLSDTPEGRTGYCEQFASAMAVMARSLGIPARVAVGFLQPEQVDDGGVWEYSSNDLHAWPELFFPGAGWVRFEPTPAGRAADVPSYTQGVTGAQEVPEVTPGQGSEQAPDLGEDPGGAGATSRAPTTGTGSATRREGVDVAAVLSWAGGLLLVAGLAAGPRGLRTARSRRRWARDPVEAAWAELADTVVDHGRTWPSDRSPAEVRRVVGPPLEQAPDTGAGRVGDALDRLVGAVEVSRYAPSAPPPDTTGLRLDVETLREALAATSSRPTRLAALWLARSLLRRPAPRGRGTTRRPVAGSPAGATVVDQLT